LLLLVFQQLLDGPLLEPLVVVVPVVDFKSGSIVLDLVDLAAKALLGFLDLDSLVSLGRVAGDLHRKGASLRGKFLPLVALGWLVASRCRGQPAAYGKSTDDEQ